MRSNGGLGVTVHERDVDDDSYDEVDEYLNSQESYEEERAYFPVEDSKPPHYWDICLWKDQEEFEISIAFANLCSMAADN